MGDTSTKPASRLQEIRLARGFEVAADLARAAGMQQPTLSKIDLGQRNVTSTFRDKLAAALRIPVEALYMKVGSPIPPPTSQEIPEGFLATETPAPNARLAQEAPEYPAIAAMKRDVPVYGSAQGGEDGVFELNSLGEPVDYVRRPAGLVGMKNVFAIYVEGDSMDPWRSPGQFVYVHPTRPANIGDYVIVVIPRKERGAPPLAYIKRLKQRTADTYVVSQFNPPKDLVFPRHEGVKVLRVIDWGEALGV